MSSTRTAKDDSVFHQSRYASNPEFERGLLGNLVAKRAALLDDAADRELIWFVHYLSHQAGGLAVITSELIGRYSDRIGTATMATIKKTGSQNYTADEIRKIRLEIPAELRHKFPLKGELKSQIRELRTKHDRLASSAEIARALRAFAEESFQSDSYEKMVTGAREEIENKDQLEASKHPAGYSVSALRDFCLRVAKDGVETQYDCPATPNLERALQEMCLNPEWNFSAGGPWYFRQLTATLRDYLIAWVKLNAGGVETKLGRMVADEFDYTVQSRCLSLLSGEARRGKSFAAKNCCLKNPGKARFVEVPSGNDDTSFFRALARGLGLGNFLKYKTIDIRERVESVLLSGDLALVLDEAQRLWPECWQRYARPARINWVMTMANAKVPILLVSTPQFFTGQNIAEKTGWNSAQLTGRIFNYKVLPSELDNDDLMAVCQSVLPEATDHVLRVLSAYARQSARYLSAIESIAMRARYLAGRAGRAQCNAEDIRAAMNESVIPSDNRLNTVLEKTRIKPSRQREVHPIAPALEKDLTTQSASRATKPIAASEDSAPRARYNITEFATA